MSTPDVSERRLAVVTGARARRDVLCLEHLGEPLRFAEIDPGMVETELSLVHRRGDR